MKFSLGTPNKKNLSSTRMFFAGTCIGIAIGLQIGFIIARFFVD